MSAPPMDSLLVVGAGPAGLMAAWAAAQQRPHGTVRVCERLSGPGVKLAATGGGRGNLSHVSTECEFAASFGRAGRFTLPAFRSLSPDALCRTLAAMGIPSFADASGRVYPKSQSAPAVRDALYQACQKAGVRMEFNREVHHLTPPSTPNGPWMADSRPARCVLLAAGGQSTPALGSNGSGFHLAARLGYSIVPPVPALAPIQVKESWPRTLSGVSLPVQSVSIAGSRLPRARAKGDILFTHRGLSGPAILDLSACISRLLAKNQPVLLRLSWLDTPPDFPGLRQTNGRTRVLAWLARHIPRSLATALVSQAGISDDLPFSRLTSAQEIALRDVLLNTLLTVEGVSRFSESMVTSGGISLKEIHPDTLQGRRTNRLYFAGEILDLDGPTGGWNLQWAFCSGWLAGHQALLS